MWEQARPKRRGRFTLKRLEAALQLLAFKIINENEDEYLSRQKLLASFGDEGLIQVTLYLGILDDVQGMFRFRSKTMQNYYAAQTIQQDSIYTRLSYPDFDTNGQYQPTAWDEVIQMLVYSLSSTEYTVMVENIAEVDPFLAAHFLQHRVSAPDHIQHDIIHKLLDARRNKHYPDRAIRDAVSQLNNLAVTRDTLVEIQRSHDWGLRQLAFSLFFELDIEVPDDVIEQIDGLDRTFPDSISDILADYHRLHLISLLIMLTTHPGVRIRRNTIWLMGQLQDKATIPALMIAIEDKNQHIVQETISTLGLIGDTAVLPFVLRVANYPAPTILTEIITLLHSFKRRVLGCLLTLYQQTQTPLSSEFTRLLAQVDETSLAEIIITTLPDDIRAQFSKPVTVPENPSEKEGDTVKQLLEMISNHMQTLRNHEAFNEFVNSFTSRQDALDTLTASELKDRIRGRKSPQPVQDAPTTGVDSVSESTDIPQPLIEALQDDDWAVRQNAVAQLSAYDGKQTLALLLEAYKDADCQVRIVALEALAKLKDFPIALETLVDALDDDDDFVRLAAVQSIMSLLEKDAVPLITHKLYDPYSHIRWATIQHLAAYPQRVSLEHFEAKLNDYGGPTWKSKSISDYAVEALKRIDSRASHALLDTWKQSKPSSQ
ncbi:MAG: HEAT repeat domain-containing protein [Anaerolineae bacterium]|nr:HEAT repeat domain-containing protein [Anaerolineae bacterium]